MNLISTIRLPLASKFFSIQQQQCQRASGDTGCAVLLMGGGRVTEQTSDILFNSLLDGSSQATEQPGQSHIQINQMIVHRQATLDRLAHGAKSKSHFVAGPSFREIGQRRSRVLPEHAE